MLASDVTGEYAGDPENDGDPENAGDPENEGLIPGEKCGLAFGESPGAFFAATCAVGAEDS
eukprot:COSAG02_NODE_16812_length_1054_cov_1.208377_2_plen_61_part_00